MHSEDLPGRNWRVRLLEPVGLGDSRLIGHALGSNQAKPIPIVDFAVSIFYRPRPYLDRLSTTRL